MITYRPPAEPRPACPAVLAMPGFRPVPCGRAGAHEDHVNKAGTIRWRNRQARERLLNKGLPPGSIERGKS